MTKKKKFNFVTFWKFLKILSDVLKLFNRADFKNTKSKWSLVQKKLGTAARERIKISLENKESWSSTKSSLGLPGLYVCHLGSISKGVKQPF